MKTLSAQSLACRRNGRTIFRDINFSLKTGDMLMVTGANGSGKTSLLRQLAGLLPLAGGDICWDGRSITDDPLAYQQQLQFIGHVEGIKAEMTAREMLQYWCVLRGLKTVDNVIDHLSVFGLEAFVDQPVRRLSAGQKRRLALTRLVLDPVPLWLLDEPATALDRTSTEKLVNVVGQHCASGGIVVMVTHHDVGFKPSYSFQLTRKGNA